MNQRTSNDTLLTLKETSKLLIRWLSYENLTTEQYLHIMKLSQELITEAKNVSAVLEMIKQIPTNFFTTPIGCNSVKEIIHCLINDLNDN